MTEIEKLRALLPHWMEHNQEHAADFVRWADRAAATGHKQAAELIRRAADEIEQANNTLQLALDDLGGAIALDTHHHTH